MVVVSAMYIVWCLQHNYSMQTKAQLAWCVNMESLFIQTLCNNDLDYKKASNEENKEICLLKDLNPWP